MPFLVRKNSRSIFEAISESSTKKSTTNVTLSNVPPASHAIEAVTKYSEL